MTNSGLMQTSPTHAMIPEDRCHWALIPAAALGGASRAQLQRIIESNDGTLDEALQRWLPVPLEEIHATYAAIDVASGEPVVVACAVQRSILDAALEYGNLEVNPEAIPARITERLGATTPDLITLNLLHGAYEPRPVRLARRTFAWAAIAGITMLTGILYLGMERRSEFEESRALSVRTAVKDVLKRMGADGDAGTADARAAAEIRRLKAAASQASSRQPGVDAAELLAQILGHWPKEANRSGLYVTTQSLQVARGAITLTMVIPADADAEPLIESLKGVPGWTVQQSQRTALNGNATDRSARLVLRLVPIRSERKATSINQDLHEIAAGAGESNP